MPVVINEARAHAPRLALDVDFAGWPPDGGSDHADLWRRLWFTLGALIVYRIASYIPIPGVDLLAFAKFFQATGMDMTGLLDFWSGGALQRISFVALGIAPYVSAVVIVQLAAAISPRLRSLAMEGPTGRRALNQYARIIMTVGLAGLQAIGLVIAFESVPKLVPSPSHTFEIQTVLALVAGAVFAMWLAEQITERGIGDGVLLILACGVISRLPFAMNAAFELVMTGELQAYWLVSALATATAIFLVVVAVERAIRRIWVYDPLREGVATSMRGYAHLRLQINSSGILAPLAASLFVTPLWDIAADMSQQSWPERLVSSGAGYVSVEGLLVFFFAVFCGLAAFDPEQIAKKLKDSGGWIPGFRPGANTAAYLRRTRTVLALFGAVYLVMVCALPDLVYRGFHLPLPLSGFSFFLLAWVMVRILDSMRPTLRP